MQNFTSANLVINFCCVMIFYDILVLQHFVKYLSVFCLSFAIISNAWACQIPKTQGFDRVGCVEKNFATVVHENKVGLVNPDGDIVIPVEYEFIDRFSEGVVAVQKDKQWGFVNIKNEVVIPFEYDYAGSFFNGRATVLKNDNWYLINNIGEIVTVLPYLQVNNFHDGLALVLIQGLKFAFMDSTGQIAIPMIYDYAHDFSEGLASVRIGEKFGFINTKGEIVIPLQYDFAFEFDKGLAIVEKDNRYGLIDKTGKIVVPIIYPSLVELYDIRRQLMGL